VRVLVTGGSGLVGSHTIERLVLAGHDVQAMVRSPAGRSLVESLGAHGFFGSVEEPQSWDGAPRCDAIVHAAALVVERAGWERYRAVNVHGTRLAVDTAARHGARMVHISSVAVYGRRPEGGPVVEDAPFEPIDELDYYARSKRLAEATLWQRADELDVSAVALRPCVIYGERDRIFMARLLDLLRLGIVPMVGRGDNDLAVVYAGNVAEAVLCALARPEARGAFNTANDGGITPREFFETVGEATGVRLRFVRLPVGAATALARLAHFPRRLFRPGRYTPDPASGVRFMTRSNPYTSARAERDLGWRPSTRPRDALRRTAEWFVTQRKESTA
jgi:nucleoside-diphosphate-sugar epimerase